MATRRVLKNLLLMSAMAGALLVAGPTQAGDRYLGQHHEYRHHDGGRDGGRSWRGQRGDDDRGYRGGHREYLHGWQGYGWGYRPYGYYPAPRRYYPSQYHRHYRGCGHNGYHAGLVEFLVDYSRYD